MVARLKASATLAVASAALAASFASGCSQRPLAVAPIAETQARWETGRHWQKFAQVAAAEIVQAANAERFGDAVPPFFVGPIAPGSAFGETFRAMLMQELSQRGASVAVDPEGATIVNATVRPIARDDRRPRIVPGPFTLVGGVASGAELISDGGFGLPEAAAVIGLGALLDAFLLDQPRSEVAVSLTVLREGLVAFTATEMVYVPRDSLPEYVSALAPPLPLATVVAGPATRRTMSVVGEAER